MNKKIYYEVPMDIAFIKEAVMQLHQEGRCYAYKDWQVEEIRELAKINYGIEIIDKKIGWYWTIHDKNRK